MGKIQEQKRRGCEVAKGFGEHKKITDFCLPTNAETEASNPQPCLPVDQHSTPLVSEDIAGASTSSAELQSVQTAGNEDTNLPYSDDLAKWDVPVTETLRAFYSMNGVSQCQNKDSNFSASETSFPGESFRRRCTNPCFFESN